MALFQTVPFLSCTFSRPPDQPISDSPCRAPVPTPMEPRRRPTPALRDASSSQPAPILQLGLPVAAPSLPP